MITYLVGDATRPTGAGKKIIVHICNNIGAWGSGFVLALSRRWPEPEKEYRAWHQGRRRMPFQLGRTQFVQVEKDIFVINLIGQDGIRSVRGIPPIRYKAVSEGLEIVCAHAKAESASVHMPRIGCGLAGGRWAEMEPIIKRELDSQGVQVYVYDLER